MFYKVAASVVDTHHVDAGPDPDPALGERFL